MTTTAYWPAAPLCPSARKADGAGVSRTCFHRCRRSTAMSSSTRRAMCSRHLRKRWSECKATNAATPRSSSASRDSELVRSGYAVHVAIGGGYTTRLTLVNPASAQQQLQLTLNGTTVQRTIPANGRLDESLAEMFNISSGNSDDGISEAANIRCTRRQWICRNFRLRRTCADNNPDRTRSSAPADVFSHRARRRLFYRPRSSEHRAAAATVTIEVDSPTGAILASKVVTLQGGERLIGLLSELFPNIQNQMGGFVRVNSTLPIYGLRDIWQRRSAFG